MGLRPLLVSTCTHTSWYTSTIETKSSSTDESRLLQQRFPVSTTRTVPRENPHVEMTFQGQGPKFLNQRSWGSGWGHGKKVLQCGPVGVKMVVKGVEVEWGRSLPVGGDSTSWTSTNKLTLRLSKHNTLSKPIQGSISHGLKEILPY